ncbi:MAG: patatin-like phospholipase family protein [Mesorhizobium sp.]
MDTRSEIMMLAGAGFAPGHGMDVYARRTLTLALSGGTHSAFTWGMLDRLLDEPGLFIAGIAASGFDAMNGAVLAYGLALGGRRGAQTALANFWRRISHAAISGPMQLSLHDQAAGIRLHNEVRLLPSLERTSSLQPSPLRSLLRATIDLEAVQTARHQVKLSVRARNARTGADRIFAGDEISIDAIVAAATTPFLFRPIEIDGELYWSSDANAEPFPTTRLDDMPDLLVVSHEVFESRMSFRHRRPAADQRRSASVQFGQETDWGSLTELRDSGRDQAENWLAANCWVIDAR